MMRASMIDMMFRHVTVMRDSDIESSAPVTLMNADIERISSGFRYVHDVWACIVEIPIALYLLWRQLGIASVAPIVVVVGKYLALLLPLWPILTFLSLYVDVCAHIFSGWSASKGMAGGYREAR
jgi:hypothetical protein